MAVVVRGVAARARVGRGAAGAVLPVVAVHIAPRVLVLWTRQCVAFVRLDALFEEE